MKYTNQLKIVLYIRFVCHLYSRRHCLSDFNVSQLVWDSMEQHVNHFVRGSGWNSRENGNENSNSNQHNFSQICKKKNRQWGFFSTLTIFVLNALLTKDTMLLGVKNSLNENQIHKLSLTLNSLLSVDDRRIIENDNIDNNFEVHEILQLLKMLRIKKSYLCRYRIRMRIKKIIPYFYSLKFLTFNSMMDR